MLKKNIASRSQKFLEDKAVNTKKIRATKAHHRELQQLKRLQKNYNLSRLDTAIDYFDCWE